jgi:hypothetical protein
MFGRDAEAQGGAFPKRIVIVNLPNWTTDANTLCGGTGADFTFSETYKSLEPYRSDMLIVDGLDNMAAEGAAHSHAGNLVLLNGGEGASIDQWIAQQPEITTAVRSLVVGAGTRNESGRDHVISFAGANRPIVPEANPAALWAALFQDFKVDPTQRNTTKDANKGVLDNVAVQLNNLKRLLPQDDQLKLEAHNQSIVELQAQIQRAVYDCTVPAQPEAFAEYNRADMLKSSPLQMDLITTAMACDLSRVATLYYGHERGGPTMDWVGGTTHYHDSSHSSIGESKYEQYSRGRTWLVEQYAGLVKRFKDTPEGNGSMLDNSVLAFTSCMGSSNRHAKESIPFVLAGGAGGALSTGRYVTYPGGTPVNRMLMTLAHAMGYPIDMFGEAQYCADGPLADLHA